MVDDGSIDVLGILGQAFQYCLGGTALSSRVRILFGEMLLHEFEERLLGIRLSLCSLLLSSHGGQDRKTSSCGSSWLLNQNIQKRLGLRRIPGKGLCSDERCVRRGTLLHLAT